ncbi:MAG TPA: sulfotransferase [Chitinophagales bacterium]|nr:sulfotransferase [Chitinophagales bacterium]
MNLSPVIILGMHRSGTTMITKMLEEVGLFVGAEVEVNHEALFFWEINNWIFDIHTATAEKPYNLRYTNPACRDVIRESLEYFVQSDRRKKYLGKHSHAIKDIRQTPFPYGWKDPKNTFTIEFWKDIFPDAKIIHIYRNPIDSVSSYIERDLLLKNKFEWNWKKKLKRRFLISKNFHENFRLINIQEGYNLWEEYVMKALSLKNDFPDYIDIRYEDFLANPFEKLALLSRFSGLQPSDEQLKNAVSRVKSDRAFAFLQNPAYVEIYQQLKEKPLMQQLGYDNL